MLVEIRGVGTHNKGAELMLQVVLEQIKAAAPDTQFVVERWFGSYEDRAKYQLRTVLPEGGIRSKLIRKLASPSLRGAYGLVDPNDIEAVVDASGFAFGAQWGTQNLSYLARRASDWRRRKIPTVFLPQAWGPFETAEQKRFAGEAIANLDLVFAREQTSLDHLQTLSVNTDHVHRRHDFTNLASGIVPAGLNLPERFACVVPNIRMLDKAAADQQTGYIDFLCASIKRLEQNQIQPLFLFHERVQDESVAEKVHARLGRELETITSSCPRELKGIIGKSMLVLGSRFHALVGSLCQGVPVVATSWSHKYEELVREYGVPELVVSPTDQAACATAIQQATESATREDLVNRITQQAAKFREESHATFADCLGMIGLKQ